MKINQHKKILFQKI